VRDVDGMPYDSMVKFGGEREGGGRERS